MLSSAHPDSGFSATDTGPHPSWRAELVALSLACLSAIVVLYHDALRCYLLGDDFAFFYGDPDWLRHSLLPNPTVWHYRPLNEIMLHLSAAVTNTNPPAMHAVNLLAHLVAGISLYFLLRHFGLDRRVRLMAPVLFVSRGIGYEAVTWISTLSYLMTVNWALWSVAWWDAWLQGRSARYAAWAISGFAAALLTIEHAILLLPLYVMLDLLLGRPRSLQVPNRHFWTRGARIQAGIAPLTRAAWRYAPFVLLVIVFLAIKYASHNGLLMSSLAGSTEQLAPIPSGRQMILQLPPERTWLGLFNAPAQACRDLMAGITYLFLPSGTALGVGDTWLTRSTWVSLPAYLALVSWVLWKGRPVTRFFMGWVHLYLLPMSVAGVPQARFHYMMMAPAATLAALAWVGTWDHVPVRWRPQAAAVSVALLIALVGGEAVFVHARLKEWRQASGLVAETVTTLNRDVSKNVKEIRFVNFPVRTPGVFWPVPTFENATSGLVRAIRTPRSSLRADAVYDRTFVGGRWPTDGNYQARDAINRDLGQPGLVTYEFLDDPPRIVRR